ncbi:hypothetical protein HU200_018611 [Digitaria exilis]|uniref:Uncharacterized protein n=1 Tax=Digitaria exilis TaxID=1010633 RepID=A0A835KE74_9POAL|nr:hypothetical protein HU200_018611 [Digitaria exilis]CAB3500221.1 unnamed protein product [Digitaria exilis]
MPKRYRRDNDGDEGGRGGSRDQRRRHHLCVVLDDWSKGYSLYNLDVDDLDGDPTDADLHAERLPDPPLFRLEIPADERGRFASFAAAGSSVFAIDYIDENKEAPVLVHDMATGALAVGPATPPDLGHSPDLVSAAGSLFAFDGWKDARGQRHQSFKALKRHGRRGWVSRGLPDAPFDVRRVRCHAAHPDGRTVLFSAGGSGTFAFDAEAEAWARHGEWVLPFKGQAFYDGEAEAWVGFSWAHVGEGRVCACDIADPAPASDGDGGGARRAPPEWKVVEEGMTHGSERSLAVRLAHLGDGRFCLVEYMKRRGVPEEDVWDEHCLLRATKFRLRYDKNGTLRAASRRARCYAVRKKSNTFSFRAFGISE